MGRLWSCNFNSQLANALIIEGDYNGSVLVLEQGLTFATEMFYPELQVCLNRMMIFTCQTLYWDQGMAIHEVDKILVLIYM